MTENAGVLKSGVRAGRTAFLRSTVMQHRARTNLVSSSLALTPLTTRELRGAMIERLSHHGHAETPKASCEA